MKIENTRAIKMLSTALQMEEKGESFYEKAVQAHISISKPVQDIFRMLMADEIVHLHRIEKIYKTLTSGKRWSGDWKKIKANPQKLRAFFKKLSDKHGAELKFGTSDVRAMDVGIDFELKAIKFYEGYLSKAKDPLEKEFLAQMIDEEHDHYSSLSDMKSYLLDPVGWFREKERPHLDGG